MPTPISDNPVYQEAYYQGGEESYSDRLIDLLFADGANCSTPEMEFVPPDRHGQPKMPTPYVDYGTSSGGGGDEYYDFELYASGHPLD